MSVHSQNQGNILHRICCVLARQQTTIHTWDIESRPYIQQFYGHFPRSCLLFSGSMFIICVIETTWLCGPVADNEGRGDEEQDIHDPSSELRGGIWVHVWAQKSNSILRLSSPETFTDFPSCMVELDFSRFAFGKSRVRCLTVFLLLRVPVQKSMRYLHHTAKRLVRANGRESSAEARESARRIVQWKTAPISSKQFAVTEIDPLQPINPRSRVA